ncbi:MAG TPA: hypothetical protein VGG61_01070 [Gemmataceae bacterium]
MITEADILSEIITANRSVLNREAAKSILDLRFTKTSEKRVRQLLRKNNQGTITALERRVLEKYLRVGQFLDLFQAKARLSLEMTAKAR